MLAGQCALEWRLAGTRIFDASRNRVVPMLGNVPGGSSVWRWRVAPSASVPAPGGREPPSRPDTPRMSSRSARFRMRFFTGSSAPPVDVDAAQGANLGKEFPQCDSLQG